MEVNLLSWFVIVTGAGQCAADAINAATPSKPLARVCLHVPGEIAWDDCQCGSFQQTATRWLYSDNARTETVFNGDDNICEPAYVGLEVVAEVLRCVTQPDTNAGSLSPACPDLLTDSMQWHRDAGAMRRGIVCCLEALRGTEPQQIAGYQITTPGNSAGPQGMCVGSRLTYRIWLPNCDCV